VVQVVLDGETQLIKQELQEHQDKVMLAVMVR
jgi:hypothetical protein